MPATADADPEPPAGQSGFRRDPKFSAGLRIPLPYEDRSEESARMSEESQAPRASSDEAVLQQQYLRALSSFEGIVLSQIDIKNKLGDRLNYSIRTGLIILGAIAFSILVLLLTLSSQINRISGVVNDMNINFREVADHMNEVRLHMTTMEQRVALLEQIQAQTASMDRDMQQIQADTRAIGGHLDGVRQHVTNVRSDIGNVAITMDRMNVEVQAMSQDMHRMAKPARSLNKMFPFP